MRVALLGPYPPPFGGVSTHVQRLAFELEKQGIDVVLFKNKNVHRFLLQDLKQLTKFDLLHFNDMLWLDRILIGFLSILGFRCLLTIHGDNLKKQVLGFRGIKKKLLVFSLRHISHFAVVKLEIKDFLVSLGVDPQRVSVLPSFLPLHASQGEFSDLPAETQAFILGRKPLIIGNAFQMVPFADEDLYGVGLSVQLGASLIPKNPELGMVFFLGQMGDPVLFEKLKERVQELNFGDHFHIVMGHPLVPALPYADVFIRPSYEDGYGVSIAEALVSNVPAIASDVCPRPVGTLLFKTGSLEDLIEKTNFILADLEEAVNRVKAVEQPNFIDEWIHIYQSMVKQEKTHLKNFG